ncbi:MAG: FAD-dependent oxidoreductase [Verrucomicrobiales bacterium]|nr:FAD-dependent oxidoreductase [Verrucomicrobiales bacterium]
MPRIAIIGAGLSGLAAAFRLSETDHKIVVFEKSKGYSGRAASRHRNGCRYDHGANYFKLNCNEVARLLFEDLPTDDLCRILGDVCPFDESGTIAPGDPAQNAGAKWNYRGGINTLGKLLVEVGHLDVRRETRITGLQVDHEGWTLSHEGSDQREKFDAVLLTTPAPQAVELLGSISDEKEIITPLMAELKRAQYHSQFSVILNYAGSYPLPNGAYALINSDREHAIAWLSHENQKAGRVPTGETLLIAQMAPAWTQDHYHEPLANIIESADNAVRTLLPEVHLPRPQWADTQRWRYAHPHTAASLEAMKPGSEIGLFFAGDAFIGKGRIPRTIETGFVAEKNLRNYFGEG